MLLQLLFRPQMLYLVLFSRKDSRDTLCSVSSCDHMCNVCALVVNLGADNVAAPTEFYLQLKCVRRLYAMTAGVPCNEMSSACRIPVHGTHIRLKSTKCEKKPSLAIQKKEGNYKMEYNGKKILCYDYN